MNRALALIPLLTLTACGIGTRPNHELYVLKPEMHETLGKKVAMTVRVQDPEVDPGLDSPRILVMDSANHLTYYNGVAWAQPVPNLVQGFLVDALQQSHAFKAVSSDMDEVEADVLLLTDIRDFQVDKTQNPPVVKIRMTVSLVNATSRKPIANLPIQKNVTAKANHMPDLVAAFNDGMDEAAADIARWSGRVLVKR